MPQAAETLREKCCRFDGDASGSRIYAYVGNNPVNAVDPLGLKPGDIFPTADAAAIDAINSINQTSIDQNLEYGGKIKMNGPGAYSAECPTSGTRDKFALSFNKQTDANTVGDYHTHGDYSRYDKDGNIVRTGPLSDANGGLNSDKFSSSDIIGTNGVSAFLDNPNYTAYLGTPGGNILSYSPAGGVSVLK